MPLTLGSIFKDPHHLSFLEEMDYDLDSGIHDPHSETGRFLIHIAAEWDQKEIIAVLLQAGADINFPAPREDEFYGQAPLNIALSIGNNDTASFLIAQKANVKQYDSLGEFPLIKATRNSNCEKIRELIAAGADINQENLINPHAYPVHLPFKYRNALMYALWDYNLEVAKLLLDSGAAVVNSQGQSVLDYCYDDALRSQMKKEIQKRCLGIQNRHRVLIENTPFSTETAEIVCSYLPIYSCAISFFKARRKTARRSDVLDIALNQQHELHKKRKINSTI